MLLLHKWLVLMGWRAQVGSRGERLDCKASSEPAEGCDWRALFSTQCHFRFNYTPSQMVRPTVANLAQRVCLIARGKEVHQSWCTCFKRHFFFHQAYCVCQVTMQSCIFNLTFPQNNIHPSPSCLWLQCWSGTHRLLHRDWCHAGTYQAREDCGHLRARNANACPAQLHGADRGPVRLHTRRAPGGRQLRHHRSARQKPIRLHPETDADRRWRECHRNGTRVQGTNLPYVVWV